MLAFIDERSHLIVSQYDIGLGHLVDQAMLIQLESISDMLSGQNYSSISSSTSGSANTSMEDWSDDSDEEIDFAEAANEMQIA